jgi:Domain of unknown function (DUF397)
MASPKLSTLFKRTRSELSMTGDLNWRVALACNGGACIQVAPYGNQIVIGDSKNPAGPGLTYSRSEWLAFVDGARRGDFDIL